MPQKKKEANPRIQIVESGLCPEPPKLLVTNNTRFVAKILKAASEHFPMEDWKQRISQRTGNNSIPVITDAEIDNELQWLTSGFVGGYDSVVEGEKLKKGILYPAQIDKSEYV